MGVGDRLICSESSDQGLALLLLVFRLCGCWSQMWPILYIPLGCTVRLRDGLSGGRDWTRGCPLTMVGGLLTTYHGLLWWEGLQGR